MLIIEWKQSQRAGHVARCNARYFFAISGRPGWHRRSYAAAACISKLKDRWLPPYQNAPHLRGGGGVPSLPACASAARSAASCGCSSGLTEMAPSKKLRISETLVLEMPLTLPLNLTSGMLLGNSSRERRSWQLVPSMTWSWPSSCSQPASTA